MGSLYGMWILSYKMFKNKTSEEEKEEEGGKEGGENQLLSLVHCEQSGYSFLKDKRWKLSWMISKFPPTSWICPLRKEFEEKRWSTCDSV